MILFFFNMNKIKSLQKVLANTFSLYAKVHSFHWNVTGSRFHELHLLFETLYTTLWEQVDDIAEHMRVLGEFAPKNISEMLAPTEIVEAITIPSDKEMVLMIEKDFSVLISSIQEAADIAGENQKKELEGFLLDLSAGHQKTLWIIRSGQEA